MKKRRKRGRGDGPRSFAAGKLRNGTVVGSYKVWTPEGGFLYPERFKQGCIPLDT